MVNIIGKGQGWENAPVEGETWGITQLILRRPVKRVIDMNDYSLWGPVEAEEARLSRIKAMDLGIPYIDLENYPLQEIIDYFATDYFSSTVDYAIALAIYERFSEINLYGVNMSNLSEYSYQKPGVDFWCGVAIGKGINLKSHSPISTIMKTRDGLLYGYGLKQEMNNLIVHNDSKRRNEYVENNI